ncbi:hypothetical protein G2W53_006522 [Senna tora]|uniref:Uncharacterized protein n=1 Tax=Senna tora TaxID=362788 RepID=A0A834X4Y3_9FABA|nr:hypothetical protein G2W53_006522 [Senna tora]
MDSENHKAEDKCLNKILARNGSMGCSSRIYYYRSSSEGVPFKWEMQPGIPKHTPNQQELLLPPLSPPPAILSLGLPKPSISQEAKPCSSTWAKLWFWKKRNRRSKEVKELEGVNNVGLEYGSDSESVTMASPFESSFSSSSSSASSPSPSMSASSESPTTIGIYGKTLNCFPVHVSKILVSIARRE